MSLSSLLNESLAVYARSGTSDGEGGYNFTFSEVSTTDGRIYPASSSEKIIGGKWDALVTHSVIVPDGTGLQRNQYLLDGGGIYYRIIAAQNPSRAGGNVNHEKYILEETQVNNDRIVD